uniref:Integrase catalytic domain-containing protein n=1 Tax=Micrurus lemniscatus lemniscatus TaxID=129467 RepID=A0A2D4JCE3_MICLE
MKPDIKDYVKSCSICATMKHRTGKNPGLLQKVAEPTKPWEEIAELPVSGGNTVVWTVIDLFSKQYHFTAPKGLPSAKKLAKLFMKHIYKFWREFLKSIGSSQ